ncbi:NfeD family protein [Ottowia sp.]|uniref:NfeD family protein n=1 Tax=Ottowia sp. TaxID=1898956 RepID=UPI0025D342BE|nr:NfeD family protein [Ottowia sp.]MBK6616411.1 NfeD family protein [Ottowia sp.]
MSNVVVWFVVAGLLVAVELVTGTFYMLMVALGMAAGGLAAAAGMGLEVQLVCAAVVGAGATFWWNRHRRKHVQAVATSKNKDVNLDIGETVLVETASETSSGQARYRGALWQARTEDGKTLCVGAHVIREVDGSCLVLAAVVAPGTSATK